MTAGRVVSGSPHPRRVAHDTAVLERWLTEYVSAPLPELGRPGRVCPFVPAARRARTLEWRFHYGVDACDGEELDHLVVAALEDFACSSTPMGSAGAPLQSRLVVLPDSRESGWRQIDERYPALKDRAVAAGLMIAQFHPVCDVRAVHNPSLRIARAPIAHFAIRHMAAHDAQFLAMREWWLREHETRFSPTRRAA